MTRNDVDTVFCFVAAIGAILCGAATLALLIWR